jgi:hypothetical protein
MRRRDTAALTSAKYREMFGEPDDSVPATFQVLPTEPHYGALRVNIDRASGGLPCWLEWLIGCRRTQLVR